MWYVLLSSFTFAPGMKVMHDMCAHFVLSASFRFMARNEWIGQNSHLLQHRIEVTTLAFWFASPCRDRTQRRRRGPRIVHTLCAPISIKIRMRMYLHTALSALYGNVPFNGHGQRITANLAQFLTRFLVHLQSVLFIPSPSNTPSPRRH